MTQIDIEEVKKGISSHKYYIESLDHVNISQSVHELKLYVSYLLEIDKINQSFSLDQSGI